MNYWEVWQKRIIEMDHNAKLNVYKYGDFKEAAKL